MKGVVALLLVLHSQNAARAKDPEVRVWSDAQEEKSKREWKRRDDPGHFWVRLDEKERAARRLLLEASNCEYGTPFDRLHPRPGGPKVSTRNAHPRAMSIRVPQCESPGSQPSPLIKFCAASLHCTNSYADFSVLDIICAAKADGECPDAKSCALAVDLEVERPAPAGNNRQMILERFPMRGSPQEVRTK